MSNEPTLTDERLAELQAIVEAASPGPWNFVQGEQASGVHGPEGSITWDDHGGEVFTEADARHIAALDQPTATLLLAMLQAGKARAEAAEAKLSEILKLHDPSDWHPAYEVCAECLDAEAVQEICAPEVAS